MPKIALLFAAQEALEAYRQGSEGRLALFSIEVRAIQESDQVSTVAVPAHSNMNLAAQRGVFTMPTRFGIHGLHAQGVRDADEAADILAQRLFSPFAPTPLEDQVPSVKITLPWSETPKLIWALRHEEVTSESLYPGYAGAAAAALVMNRARKPRVRRQ